MTYSKPELKAVGSASAVILGSKATSGTDAQNVQPANQIPAYDLDE